MEKRNNLMLVTLGVIFFIVFLLAPVFFATSKFRLASSMKYGALTFYGLSATDLAQDMIGFRGMAKDQNAYPNLAQAHADLGLDFPLDAVSTHLPTTFLFVAPVAFMPWRQASIVWALLMLLGVFVVFRMIGFSWPRAIAYGFLSILWLPMMMSFGQLTIVWLVLVVVAYNFRNTKPAVSGFLIGTATLLKLFPALLMIPHLFQKKWNAVSGFLAAIVIGIAVVLALSPQAIWAYLNSEQNIQTIILRSDNASLFNVGYQNWGVIGVGVSLILLGIFLALNRKSLLTGEAWIQKKSWMLWSFLSVALLPVIWIYSLVPLLPIILDFIGSNKKFVRVLGWAAIIIPVLGYPWGDLSVPYIAASTLLIGLGITLTSG